MFNDLNQNVFDKDLLKVAVSICADNDNVPIYIKNDDGSFYNDGTIYSTIRYLGFNDCQKIETFPNEFDEDKHDVNRSIVGHMEFEGTQVYALYFGGTVTPEQMGSNFDVGYDGPEYMVDENIHLEWKHKINHKGYDVAAVRLFNRINNYISTYKNNDLKQIYFITGHSRGGSIGNLISKELTDSGNKVFTYLFAPSNCTCEENNERYNNIFNITNTDDLINYIPPQECGFKVYGKRITFSIKDNLSLWEKKAPGSTYYHSDINALVTAMKNIFDCREKIYILPTDQIPECFQSYETRLEAIEARIKFANMFEDGDIAKIHTSVSEVTQVDEQWGFYLDAAPGFILDIVDRAVDSISSGEGIEILKLILEVVMGYLPFLGRYIKYLIPVIMSIDFEHVGDQFLMPHLISTYLMGTELLCSSTK